MSTVYVLVIIFTLIFLVITYLKYRHGYWKRRGVPFIKPSPILGNLQTLVGGQSVGIITATFYKTFKERGVRFGGAYLLTNPVLILIDLELIKNVMTKDSQYFINRGVYYNEKYDPLAPDLFNIGGARWKNVRVKISPNYTSGKMKAAFDTMLTCCNRIESILTKRSLVDIKEMFCCYTTDLNFLCSFGFECNSIENPITSFRNYGKKFFEIDLWKQIKHTLSVGMPTFSRNVGIVTRNKEVSHFWRSLFLDAVKYREQENYVRDDLLQMLMAMKETNTLTLDEVAAHSLLFFIASFETSSSAMTFCMYEIARHLEVQKRIRKEVRQVCSEFGGKLTYEAVMSMKYLRQVLDGKPKFFATSNSSFHPIFRINEEVSTNSNIEQRMC